MKTILKLLYPPLLFGIAYGMCCVGDQKTQDSCGIITNQMNINLSCPFSRIMLLKNTYLKENKLFSDDGPNKDYCLAQMYKNDSNIAEGTIPVALVCLHVLSDKGGGTEAAGGLEITGYLTLTSVLFLVLTLGVYLCLPQLRDLQGLCYMSMCLSMALGFLSLGTIQLSPTFLGNFCTVTGFTVYFWMIATFFWMNVISINVNRGIIEANTYNSGATLNCFIFSSEKMQYFVYSCYAWGGAIFLLVISLITFSVDGDHLKPDIGESSCWFNGRAETWLFFYGPIALLITSNLGLFLCSSYMLWRQTRKYETSKLNNLKYKFLLSLKLFLVMGISWIFEIASFAHGESHIIWSIMDIVNCLQGVIIFILLVLLRKRAVQGFADMGFCIKLTKPLAEKLNPHDEEDQPMLENEHTEVRLD